MRRIHAVFSLMVLSLLLSLLSACAPVRKLPPPQQLLAYRTQGEGLLHQHSPVFVVEYPEHEYNRIGTPKAETFDAGSHRVYMDTGHATVFAEQRTWQGQKGSYTNLIYRIHFSEIPFRFLPFRLGAGKNIGLFVIITINADKQPLLVTTLHTCGCYLAFVPTSFLDPASLPDNWNQQQQYIYGEFLPGILPFQKGPPAEKVNILLRDGTHRVKNIWIEVAESSTHYPQEKVALKSLVSLTMLENETADTISFFETEGPRTGYVVDSQKFWERLLISWWTLDWRVGEDKRLGLDRNDGIIFYTSLKPWAREESDMRDFAAFLDYWGWKL